MAINAQDSVAMSATGAQADDRNPIVQALHEMAVTVLGEQLRTMFEKADDILFDSAEKAQSSDEQRLYLRSEEHTSELQSLMRISYAVLCLKQKTETNKE